MKKFVGLVLAMGIVLCFGQGTGVANQNIIGSVSATFNVQSRNQSQSSNSIGIQNHAKANLMGEATKRFPNAVDIININVAKQKTDMWQEGSATIVSCDYIATGQVVGPLTNIIETQKAKLGTIQTKFNSTLSADSKSQVIIDQARLELKITGSNRYEGEINIENINVIFIREEIIAGVRNFQFIAEGDVLRIR